MRVEKTTKYKKKLSFFDYVQYFISMLISISFLLGLIPFFYDNVFRLAITLIMVQIIISLFRLRIFNILIELFLLFLSVISLVPVFGYIFRFLGFLVGILEMTSFKNYKLYKKIEVRNFYPSGFNSKNNSQKDTKSELKKSKNKVKFQDAKFKEK